MIEIALMRGRTLADIDVVLRMHPRDLATCIDFWEERDADERRGRG